jgi:hypothetical protein
VGAHGRRQPVVASSRTKEGEHPAPALQALRVAQVRLVVDGRSEFDEAIVTLGLPLRRQPRVDGRYPWVRARGP